MTSAFQFYIGFLSIVLHLSLPKIVFKRRLIFKQETTEVWIPALDISTWTSQDVLTALKDPQTKEGLIPYLKEAQKQLEEAKAKGQIKVNSSFFLLLF